MELCETLVVVGQNHSHQSFNLVGHALKFLALEPLGVVIAAVAEAVGQGFAFIPTILVPERMRGFDDKHIFKLNGIPGFVFRDEDFMELFAVLVAYGVNW